MFARSYFLYNRTKNNTRLTQKPMGICGIGRYNGCVFFEAEETTDDLNISYFTKKYRKKYISLLTK
jgi:hypothetical protein